MNAPQHAIAGTAGLDARATASSPSPRAVESVWIEPPLRRPPAIAVLSAPPPMLVQPVPPAPFNGAVWIGGYWVWHRRWVWSYGMWSGRPGPDFEWVHPRYEHRGGLVVFVTGHWADTDDLGALHAVSHLAALASPPAPLAGDPAAVGPEGIFVPAPPGSRAGLIVPAPLGTAPAVVTQAPAVVRPGMRVHACAAEAGTARLRIIAPAEATACGRAVDLHVPALAHQAAFLAAGLQASAEILAPLPRSELSVRYSQPRRASSIAVGAETTAAITLGALSLAPSTEPAHARG